MGKYLKSPYVIFALGIMAGFSGQRYIRQTPVLRNLPQL